MLMPSIFGESLFDDFMNDFLIPTRSMKSLDSYEQLAMKTDIKETEDGYQLEIDLPGFKKEDVKAQLKDGYLTISTKTSTEEDQKDSDGKYIRRERYTGSMSRSFYVGENLTEEDIHAKFENGILLLTLPKDQPKKLEETKYIAIEG